MSLDSLKIIEVFSRKILRSDSSKKKNLYLDAPSLTVDSDYATIAASSDMLLYGGNDTLVYCESGPVETASGGDPIIATSLTEKILAALKNAKMLFTSGAI